MTYALLGCFERGTKEVVLKSSYFLDSYLYEKMSVLCLSISLLLVLSDHTLTRFALFSVLLCYYFFIIVDTSIIQLLLVMVLAIIIILLLFLTLHCYVCIIIISIKCLEILYNWYLCHNWYTMIRKVVRLVVSMLRILQNVCLLSSCIRELYAPLLFPCHFEERCNVFVSMCLQPLCWNIS